MKKEPKPKHGEIGPENQRYAKDYGANVRTIQRWREQGAPLSNPAEMAVWLSARRSTPEGSATASGLQSLDGIADIGQAKLAKTILECKKIAFRNDAEQKLYLPIDQVKRDARRIGSAMRSELLRFAGDVPNWEGLRAVELQKRVDKFIEGMLESLSNQSAAIYGDS